MRNQGATENTFGIAGVVLVDANTRRVAANITLPMTLEVDLNAELKTTMGGASRAAVSARMGRPANTIKLTVNGMSPELKSAVLNGVIATTAASAVGNVGAAVDSSAAARTPSEDTTVAATDAAAGPKVNGVLSAVATAAATAEFNFVGEDGVEEKVAVDTSAAATVVVASAGLNIVTDGTGGAMDIGATSEWQIRAGHGGIATINADLFSRTKEYRMVAVSRAGGAQDPTRQIEIKRLVFGGYTLKMGDDTPDNEGVELNGVFLTPLDGSAPIVDTIIARPA